MKQINLFLKSTTLALITVFSTQAYAAGYKMEFQTASVLADGGQAAVVEDAGTNWYNAAGLVDLPQQAVMSLIGLYVPTRFTGSVTAPDAFFPPSSFAGSGAATAYNKAALPSLHYVLPIKDRYAFGISMVPAWGFIEDFGLESVVRYTITRVYTKTIDISPSVAMKWNDQWSFGLGPDFNYFSVSDRFNVRTQGPFPFGTPGDSMARFSASTWGYGWHAGVLYHASEATRFGLSYRSKVVSDMSGYSSFVIDGVGTLTTNQFKLNIPFPPVTTLSAYHDLNPRWAVMGTIAYDQWSVIRNYNAYNIIQPPAPGTLTNLSILQSFNNTFDFSVGTHYKYNEKTMLRGSLKYLPTPTNNRDRDLSFPDGNKFGVNIGSRYQFTPKVAMDVIYGHVFVQNAKIRSTNALTGATASGHTSSHIDLFGGQLVWDI